MESKNKIKNKDWKDWCELFEYVKGEILQYNKDMKMPKYMILRLKGLNEGKFMANRNQKPNANYPFKTILLTFKMSMAKINAYILKNANKFTNEQHKFNGIMVIIENEINDVVKILRKTKKSEEKTKNTKLKHQVSEISKYEKRGKRNNNKNLDNLW